MWHTIPVLAAVFGGGLLTLPSLSVGGEATPERFGLYYSGPPCTLGHIDKTYSQFQVNLGETPMLVRGVLQAGADGQALLQLEDGRRVQLLTNASRADWLLTYPLMGGEVGAWGREILRPDCSITEDAIYLEALFPPAALQGSIPPALDLSHRTEVPKLVEAVDAYRAKLLHSTSDVAELADSGGDDEASEPDSRRGRVAALEREMFAPGTASAETPWRVRLLGEDGEVPEGTSVDILLSGSDGSVGMFGHIAVGGDGMVYNVYPKGSERGSPEPVSLWDYLFNLQRGHVLRRPTWILRLEGLPRETVAAFHEEVRSEIRAIQEGRTAYHPTANNCTTVSMRALSRLGFDVPKARYFTRRFPRPAFTWILARLPRLIAAGKVVPRRVELQFVPQVPARLSEGGAPNRPLRDRARVPAPADGRAS